MNKKIESLFVGFGIVCMIVGLVALAQSSTPSGGPYYLQVPTSTWTYQVGVFSNGSYYMVNGTNWKVDYQSTNASKTLSFAIGNTTSGAIFVKQGTYILTNPVAMASNVTLQIESRTLFSCTYAFAKSYYEIAAWSEMHGIFEFRGTSGAWIEDAHIICGDKAFLTAQGNRNETAVFWLYAVDCSFEGFEIYNIGSDGMYLAYVNESAIRNIYMHGWQKAVAASPNHWDGIHLSGWGCYRNRIENVLMDASDCGVEAVVYNGATNGIILEATTAGSHVSENIVSNCVLKNIRGHGIYLNGGGTALVAHNILTGIVGYNVSGQSTSLVQINSGQNNYVEMTSYGISGALGSVGISLGSGDNAQTLDGSCYGNEIHALVDYMDYGMNIFIQDDNCTIRNNLVYLTTRNCNYSLVIGATAGTFTSNVTHNEFHINAQGGAESYGIGVSFSSSLTSAKDAFWNDFYCEIDVDTYGIYWGGAYGTNNTFYGNINGVLSNYQNPPAGTASFANSVSGLTMRASGYLASCANGTAIPHGMVTTPAVLTLCLHGPTAYNATMILCAPTILSVNATHMVIEFVMWETVTWTLVPVTAVEAQTVWWTAQTWNYP